MSNPAWATDVLVNGVEATVYVQLPDAVTAPVAGDVLAFVTDASIDLKGSTSSRGPWLNLNTTKNSAAGVEVSGAATVDWSKAADAKRAMMINAAKNQTRVLITIKLYATGDTYALPQCLVDAKIAIAASSGVTGEFSFKADGLTFTAGTA